MSNLYFFVTYNNINLSVRYMYESFRNKWMAIWKISSPIYWKYSLKLSIFISEIARIYKTLSSKANFECHLRSLCFPGKCNLPIARWLQHLQMVFDCAGIKKKSGKIGNAKRESRHGFSSFEIARSSGRDRELKSTRENRFVRAQRRERNDEVKRSVVVHSAPFGTSFSSLYGSTGQDRDTTVVKLKLIRLYVRFDGAFRAAHRPCTGPVNFCLLMCVGARPPCVKSIMRTLRTSCVNPITAFH